MTMLIFLPVRNGGTYITAAIDSIVAQTNQDWKLIVLENHSTDDTIATVQSYQDTRIVLVPADEPLDIVGNWKRSYAYLEAQDLRDELVTFIGHDDYLYPDYVDQIVTLARLHPDATLYQTPFDLVDAEGNLIRPARPIPGSETGSELLAALCWGIRDSFGTGYACRARHYRQVGGIPDFQLLLFADFLLFVRLAALGHKKTSARSGCAYRLHLGSASNSTSRAKMNAHLVALDRFVAALDQEYADFLATDQGGNAMASLLGRELSTFNLATARRIIEPQHQHRLARLNHRFYEVARGLPAYQWSGQSLGQFAGTLRRVRYSVNFLTTYLRTRR